MYLKQIKALGFKSFADKINLDMEGKIIGIVGPNGSGKSNVVDAVKWVLGEQSLKALRGDVMSDVIFSGSKSRTPHNYASVTLVLDNSDNYLPTPYTEVSIKRCLYRSGENDYFLNGEKCRLKDITDLLSDSGASKEAFNIISQGKVQEILSNKPEERRVIFEEAAGVLKYKKRKEESLRKLERTDANMVRIMDIINELSSQVEPLREQSEKAKKYLETKSILEETEIALVAKEIKLSNEEFLNAKNKVNSLNEAIMNLDVTSNSNSASLDKEKHEVSLLDEEIGKLHASLMSSSNELENINGKKLIAIERSNYSASDMKIHERSISLKEQIFKNDNNITSLEIDLKSLEADMTSNNINLNDIKEKINVIKSLIDKENIELSKQTREISECEYKINLISASIENNALIPSAVKSVLNNPKLEGVHNIIGALFETNEAYSLCLEMTLGSALNNIVVDNEESAKEAINYLKKNSLGRVTFYPITTIKPRYIDPETENLLKNENGFISIASNLIKCDSKYRNIFLSLLGNVIIVSDIDVANKISKKTFQKYRVVTLGGEIINVGGSVTGGFKKQISILSEKQELDTISRKKSNAIWQVESVMARIKKQEEELVIKNNVYEEICLKKISLNEMINSKNIIVNEFKKKKEELDNEIKGMKGIINTTIQKEEEKLITKYYSLEKEKLKIEKNLENLIRRKKDLVSDIFDKELLIKNDNAAYNKKQQDLKETEILVNRLDVKLDNLLNILTNDYNITYEKASSTYELKLGVEESRKLVKKMKELITSLGVVNVYAINEYETVNERYTFLNNQKEDLLNAKVILLRIIDEMDQIMKEKFETTFKNVNEKFRQVFKKMFLGGHAELKLTDKENILTTGIEIIAEPPGKKLQNISLLSGGEKTLTAISLLFAILQTRIVPFCILDEAEAALDEVNVESFGKYLIEHKDKTQFIIITHKKKTMEYADVLYGITMQESGVSKIVSVRLEDIERH